MSETPNKTAEPTDNQGGGTASTIMPESTEEDSEAVVAAEPTENQGGGGD